MKVLHLHTNLNLSCGISRTIFLIAKNDSEINEHRIFTLGGDAGPRFNAAGLNVTFFNINRKGILNTLRIFLSLLKYIGKYNIDLVHSHHRYFDLLTFYLSKLTKVKSITSVQSLVYRKKGLSYKAPCLIACSESVKNHLVNYFKLKEDKIKTIYNFVDLCEVDTKNEEIVSKKKVEASAGSFVICFVGRLNYAEKGVDLLLNAVRLLNGEYKDILLIIIGDGNNRGDIIGFISKYKINARVIGPVDKVYDYYKIADVVVLPSRVEPFGIVTLEAGAAKKIFIGSDGTGIEEVVNHGINGLLFANSNYEDLAAKIEYVYKNKSELKILGENLYRDVLSKFSAESVIPQYQKLYEDVFYGKI